MTVEPLTPNNFLRLDKEDIENIFQEELPPSEGKPYFEPAPYSQLTNPTLNQMKEWKASYMEKSSERRTILNFVIPALLIGPGTIALISAAPPVIVALIFTIGTMLVVGYLWFFGRVWSWETRRYTKNVTEAEKAVERIRDQRVKEWAASRYNLPSTENIHWAEFSEFYINHRSYKWLETEDGKFIIFDQQTEKEAPLLEKI